MFYFYNISIKLKFKCIDLPSVMNISNRMTDNLNNPLSDLVYYHGVDLASPQAVYHYCYLTGGLGKRLE